MILDVIAKSKGHVGAEQILDKVKNKHTNFNISTVYRNLETLRDLGILHEARSGQNVRYELASVPAHHHLVCKNCSKVIKADNGLFGDLNDQLKNLYGFKADLNHLLISGICKNCVKNN